MHRLLIDGTALSPSAKGVGRYSLHVIQQLATLLPAKWSIEVMVAEDQELPDCPERARVFTSPRLPDLVKGLIVLPAVTLLRRADVVLAPMDGVALTAGRPLVMVLHDIPQLIEAAARERNTRLRWVLNALKDWLRRAALRRAKVVVCNSDFVAQEALRRYRLDPNRICIGYCGVDPRFYEPTDDSAQDYWPALRRWNGYVLTFATGDPRETYDLAAPAWALVKKRLPGRGLMVAGVHADQDYAAALRQDFEDEGLVHGQDFLFAAFLGDEDFQKLKALYRGADFYLELSGHEGFGMQLAEAMATGTTCISSGRGALSEVGGGFAVELPRLDAESVAAVIVDSYRADLHKRDNADQSSFTRRFSWDRVGAVLTEKLVALVGAN